VAQGKKHETSEQTKELVKKLAGLGSTAEDIALKLKINRDTLRKYYEHELSLGRIDANTFIAGTLYEQAKAGNLTAQMFWLKTRAGWKETDRKELVGNEGGDVQINIKSAILDEDD
tara:strand:- start:1271 stop:1618 length:348 start_codon:yes stop_codon:yes gene_type:complete